LIYNSGMIPQLNLFRWRRLMPDEGQILWGAAAIGAAVGLKPRRAWILLNSGLLPGRKVSDVGSDGFQATPEQLAIAALGGCKPKPVKAEPVPRSSKRKLSPRQRRAA